MEKIAIARAVEGEIAVKSAAYALKNEPKVTVGSKSIMGMMSLRLLPGEEITVVTEGKDEEAAASGIERFFINVKNK